MMQATLPADVRALIRVSAYEEEGDYVAQLLDQRGVDSENANPIFWDIPSPRRPAAITPLPALGLVPSAPLGARS